MIANFFLTAFYAILWPVVSLLPVATLPTGVSDTLAVAHQGVGLLWLVFPIDAALTAVGIVLVLETLILGFRIGDFLFNKIRGSGS